MFRGAACRVVPYHIMRSMNQDAEQVSCSHNDIVSSGIGYSTMDVPHYGSQSCSPVTSAVLTEEHLSEYGHVDNREFKYYLEPAKPPASSGVESPRIEITPSPGLFYAASLAAGGTREQYSPVTSRSTLPVPGPDNNVYRDPFSPASSASSTSCHSYVSHESSCSHYGISPQTSPVTSPCVSPKNGGSNEYQVPVQASHHSPRTSPANSPTTHIENWPGPQSPSPSPRHSSRSSSPIGKRRYSCDRSRTPSPQASPRVITRDESTFHPCSNASLAEAMSSLTTDPNNDSGEIWGKARIVDLPPPTSLKTDMSRSEKHPIFSMADTLDFAGICQGLKKDIYNPETVFLMPPHPLHWSKPKPHCGIASLPPLEWQLPCKSGQYELEIEVQPKPHHRAHYETEGSRGAVKSPSGCHPVVQLHGYVDNKPLSLQIFIGTADDRLLRPHAFYQVHRITGKTVSTTSYEKICGNTKVLEIPLLPENNMRAIIDCAGILKLRNADIELRKGETDIGRKNTRVRLVFRVHIPQPNGMFVSLQAASNPIECSQRSAHELPMVEKQNIDSCLVMGGQQMILNGQNFTPESKVLFTEKTHDGQQMWEVEATVDKDKSQPNILFVEIPRYQNQLIRTPAKVSFCVVNGKRKKSQPQRFTYLPAVPIIKTEPSDECDATLIHSVHREAISQLYYASPGMTPIIIGDPNSSYGAPCRPGVSPPDSRYQQHNPPGTMYSRCKGSNPSQLGYQSSPVMVSTIPTIQEGHRSVVVHPGSPGQLAMLHHSPVNQSSVMIHHSSNNPQSSSMLHNSPTHHQSSMIQHPPNSQQLLPLIHHSPNSQQLRYCSHQDYQHQLYLENDGQVPTVHAATPQGVHHMQRSSPTHYPAVIQQQHASHGAPKTSKNVPSPSQLASLTLAQQESEKEAISNEVTVKQEPQNLDQAYLDDVNEIIRKDLSGITARGQS